MMNRAEQLQMVGHDNYIEEGTAVKGWYTCIITGKKFRGAKAEEQFALQAEIEEADDNGDADKELSDMIESAEMDEPAVGSMASIMDSLEQVMDEADKQAELMAEPIQASTASEAISKFVQKNTTPAKSNTIDLDGKVMTDVLYVHVAGNESAKLVEIKCTDCGTSRMIKPQDVFQVKRCPDCQKAYRNAQRAERRKQKRAEAKKAKESQK